VEILDWIGSNPAAFWALVGVGFLIVELAVPGGFFLSFAVAGFVSGLLVAIGILPGGVLALLVFAILGAATIVPLRRLLARFRPQTKDINEY
jgi:membrane protein implicated in regulation of membrane protease activity